MTDARLQALERIAALLCDQKLLALQQANAARDLTRSRIADLAASPALNDCNLKAAYQAEALYQAWADERRRMLNLQLARQTVAVIQAEDAARGAFGRSIALNKLARPRR
jgi:hypothetical protein